ncbi:hypothetical protein F4806DRAFT_485899 [Annulohypoxylon nitens]|nr:hypothetical protein F4806DRAFT_485899 [Annulohypoxylon nitens]
MSIFCCCRGRRALATCREPDREIQDILDFPIHPPRAKLSKSSFPAHDVELSSSNIAVTKAPSLLHNSIPEATVDPTILEVDDSDDDEPVRSMKNSSTGTLEAIKTRFIRPLSQKSESKRHSQQYLGASEEEIARRAELRRLMHKRIQEELKSEEEQEEADSKVMSPDESKPGSSATVGLSGGGPRDNIEFSVSDMNEIRSKDASTDAAHLAPLAKGVRTRISPRRSSYPGPPSRSHDNSIHESHGNLKGQGSLSHFPSSPQLDPVHLPSARASDSLCSWRLSYSAEQLANYLGPPNDSQPDENSEPLKPPNEREGADEGDDDQKDKVAKSPSINQESMGNQELMDGAQQNEPTANHVEPPESPYIDNSHYEGSCQDSPLNMWLRSQEMHSTSIISSRRTSGMISQMALDNCDPDGASSPQKPTKDVQKASHVLSTIATEALALPCSSNVDTQVSSFELPPPWPKELRRPNDGHNSAPNDDVKSADHVRDASSSHYASSRYTTRPNSCQVTEKESRLNLIELLGGRKAIPPSTGFNRLIHPSSTTDADKSDDSSYKTAPNAASALDISMPENQQQLGLPTADRSSLAVSDTASFKQREAELKSIEQRFAQVHTQRDTTANPITSKFREEFHEPRTSILRKNSIFGKFHLPRPKKAKHPTKDIWRYSMYDVKHSDNLHQQELKGSTVDKQLMPSSNAGQKHEGLVSTIRLRQQTIMLDEDTSGAEQHQGDSSRGRKSLEISQADQEPIPTVPSPKIKSEQLKPPCRHEDDNSPQSDISNNVLREWVNLMNDQGIEHQSEPKEELQNRSPKRLRTPPASWAKWPSHTRHERTGPAGKDDNVISRDFAIRVGSNSSDITWSTDKPEETSKRYLTPGSRSLSAQLGKAVKEGLVKVVQRNSSETSRGHRKPDGHLEYPELEILPMHGGYEELQALEQQIGTMKRKSVPAERQLARLSSDNMRPPLSVRLAEEVHMMQHKASRDSWQNDDDRGVRTSLEVSSNHPRQLLLPSQGASKGIGRLETSESQVSYEDCVPKHMLEDEALVENDTMAVGVGHNTQAT